MSADYYSLPDDNNLDIKRIISLFISNWYWFAASLFIALLVAYGINRYSPKIYTISSTILIKDDQMGNVSSNIESIIPGGDIFRSQQNLNNEMGILKSFKINNLAMKNLKDFHVVYVEVGKRGIVESRMYKSSPFVVLCDSLELEPKGIKVEIEILSDLEYKLNINGDPIFEKKMSFGERFNEKGFNFTIEPRFPGTKILNIVGSNKFYFYFISSENLAEEYRSKLSVSPIEQDASLVTLSVSGLIPQQEADYLNALMEVYIDYGLDIKNQTAANTIDFIDRQLGLISDSLSVAAGNLEKFRLDNSFFDLSLKGDRVQNRVEKFENEKSSFELQLQYYNYLSEYLNDKNVDNEILSPSVMGITDPVLLRLVNEISAIQKEREKLSFNFKGDQTAVKLIDIISEGTRIELEENIKNGITGLNLLIAKSDKEIAVLEGEINKLPTTQRKLINIQRQFDLNNTVYTYLLEKRAESGIARASNVSDNRTIDAASTLNPILIKPKTKYNFVLSFLLGLFLPMVIIAVVDYFNNKVIDKSDIERKTKVPIIGYISHNVGDNEIPVVERPKSALAESFRSVRTALKFYVKENDVPVIAVSSTISSEGKTFISINLAAITALLGKRVLLVGLDLRKPRINKVFKFEDSPGMSTFLSGNCEYEEIIKETQIKNLFYAPSGPIPPNPAELIETERMKNFIEKAKDEFDFIIIDTPPVAIVTDTLLLTPYVDLNLFIVRQRYTVKNTLELIEQLKVKGELKNMAILINDISLSGYYGYGMRYGYSMGYGYSYGYNYYGSGYHRKYGNSDKTNGYYKEE